MCNNLKPLIESYLLNTYDITQDTNTTVYMLCPQLLKDIQNTLLIEKAPAITHIYQGLPVQILQSIIRTQEISTGAHLHPHRGKALHMWDRWLCTKVQARMQALGPPQNTHELRSQKKGA